MQNAVLFFSHTTATTLLWNANNFNLRSCRFFKYGIGIDFS